MPQASPGLWREMPVGRRADRRRRGSRPWPPAFTRGTTMSDEKNSGQGRPAKKEVAGYTREVTLYTKTCPVCGATFEGTARKLYDRGACATAAYKQRQGEAGRERQRGYQR